MAMSLGSVTSVTSVTVQLRGLPQEDWLPIESVTSGWTCPLRSAAMWSAEMPPRQAHGQKRPGRKRHQRTGGTALVTVLIGNLMIKSNRLTCEVAEVTEVTDAGSTDSQSG